MKGCDEKDEEGCLLEGVELILNENGVEARAVYSCGNTTDLEKLFAHLETLKERTEGRTSKEKG